MAIAEPTQELASGPTFADKYGSFGFTNERAIIPPEQALGMLAGYPGKGKSYFLRSNPGALWMNFDLASAPEVIQCQAIPKWDKTARRYNGPDGKRFAWTWEYADALRQSLIKAAAENKPRPTTIIIDTLKAMILVAERKWGTAFTVYGDIYDAIRDFILSLRDAGYGVWVVTHMQLHKSRSAQGEGADPVYIDNITHAQPLHERIFPHCELVMQAWSEPYITEKITPRYQEISGKKVKIKDDVEQVTRHRFYVTADSVSMPHVIKRRASLPDKLLVGDTGSPLSQTPWEIFTSAYNAHNS